MSSRPYWKGCAAPAEWPQGCAGLGLQSPRTNHPVHGCVPPAGTSPEPPDTGATTASSARSPSNVGGDATGDGLSRLYPIDLTPV